MNKKKMIQRFIQVLEDEFFMRNALSLPPKKPADIQIRFFSGDKEYRLNINEQQTSKKKRKE